MANFDIATDGARATRSSNSLQKHSQQQFSAEARFEVFNSAILNRPAASGAWPDGRCDSVARRGAGRRVAAVDLLKVDDEANCDAAAQRTPQVRFGSQAEVITLADEICFRTISGSWLRSPMRLLPACDGVTV